jgi:Tfp pilus assembly protein PilZ
VATIENGAVIDQKYEVLGPAQRATGGWEARHVVLRQQFIVQLLAKSVVDDPIMWRHFQDDIKAAGLLGHENIEYVTDLGRCPIHGAYLVKQWIDGPTLDQWLSDVGPRPASEAVEFAHAIGGALAALHEIGIIHGRLSSSSIRRLDRADGATWKLLDVCIPGGDELLVAPEQKRGEATGPEADQYAVALLTRQLLGDRGVPAELDAVLETAMHDMPLMRWPDVETFVAELSRASPEQPTPSIHPFDQREASRHVRLELLQDSEPKATFADARPKSMMIRVLPEIAKPSVEVDFNTGARLRREYRRNMLTGGLFAPTAGQLQVGGRVGVTLRFSPRDAELKVDATVVSHDPGSPTRPRGFGVAFDVPSRQRIEAFVKGLGLGLGISPNDVLEVLRPLDASAKLDTGAAFLLSRLRSNVKVGAARAMFSGLPYDFDECVSALVEQGYISVGTPIPAGNRRAIPGSDVARVLESAEYFEAQGNFMAASRVLESAAENAPQVGAYHQRLALLRARFDVDLRAAGESIRAARALEPTNQEFIDAERFIGTLVELAGD